MAENPIRLGTRGSALALAQARSVAARLEGAEIVEITTSGDRGSGPGDKSRFTKEIEEALLDRRIDIAIHSAKDVPAEIPEGLAISGVPAREDPRDAFVGDARTLEEVAEGARIGTSSLRRRSQLLALRPDLELIELRGNVDTRLRRLDAGNYDGLVLAAAGLRRLGRADRVAFEFEPAVLTPSPGQGSLALETRREEDRRAGEVAAGLGDERAEAELRCERVAVGELDASCHTPVGVLARLDGRRLSVRGFCGLPDGSEWIRDQIDGDEGGTHEPEALGRLLAQRMKGAGAVELLARASRMIPARSR